MNKITADEQVAVEITDDEIKMIVCSRCGAYTGDSCHSLASSGWKAVKPHRERVTEVIDVRSRREADRSKP